MTTVTSHPNGVPSWVDLATPDPVASKGFYAAIFGWTYDDQSTGEPGNDYTMVSRNGHSAAGMMKLSPEMAASGMPPVWSTYVTVADVDVAVEAIAPAGGSVLQPAMDVMDAGRMAVVADPSGAVFCLWEVKEHIGAGVVNEHGALTWTELITPDPGMIGPFYAEVLGWSMQTVPMPDGEYTLFHVEGGNENGIAGAMAPPMPGIPAYWGVYFHSDDTAETVAIARERGAQVLMEPTPMPGVGTLATLMDPQGAVFSVMTPEG